MKSSVNIFCLWLISLGVVGFFYWIYHNFIANKLGWPSGVQFVSGLLVAITVGFATTYVGIYFSEQSSRQSTEAIHEAMYPNDFKVSLDIRPGDSSGPQVPSEESYPVKAKDRKIRLRVTIHNESKYPAHLVPVRFFVGEKAFKESVGDIRAQLALAPYRSTMGDSDRLSLLKDDEKLPGFIFAAGLIQEKGNPLHIGWLDLNLNKKSAPFVVRVRKHHFPFNILFEETERKNASQKEQSGKVVQEPSEESKGNPPDNLQKGLPSKQLGEQGSVGETKQYFMIAPSVGASGVTQTGGYLSWPTADGIKMFPDASPKAQEEQDKPMEETLEGLHNEESDKSVEQESGPKPYDDPRQEFRINSSAESGATREYVTTDNSQKK